MNEGGKYFGNVFVPFDAVDIITSDLRLFVNPEDLNCDLFCL